MTGTNLSSGLLTADAEVVSRRAILTGVNIVTGGTNDATLVIYDNTAASGNELFKMVVTGTNDGAYFNLGDYGIRATIGLYADITTAGGGAFILHYR